MRILRKGAPRSVSSVVKQAGPGRHLTATLNGEFDPARGVGEETSSTGSQVRFVGGYMYLYLSDSFRAAYQNDRCVCRERSNHRAGYAADMGQGEGVLLLRHDLARVRVPIVELDQSA